MYLFMLIEINFYTRPALPLPCVVFNKYSYIFVYGIYLGMVNKLSFLVVVPPRRAVLLIFHRLHYIFKGINPLVRPIARD